MNAALTQAIKVVRDLKRDGLTRESVNVVIAATEWDADVKSQTPTAISHVFDGAPLPAEQDEESNEAAEDGDSTVTAPAFFKGIALSLVERLNVPVAPCYPWNTVHIKDGVEKKMGKTVMLPSPLTQKSKDPAQIHAWGLQEPNSNVCVYAEQVEGGLLFLDKDGAISLRQKYESDTGKPFPKTLLVRSSVIDDGNGGKITKGHWYFKQTPRTIALDKNISEDKTGGLFSLRVHNQYVASIGSIHPDTGLPYGVAEDYPPIPMPDDVLDWLLKQIVETPKTREEVEKRGKLGKGERYPALMSELGRLWNRGYDLDGLIAAGVAWARTRFDTGAEEFNETLVTEEIKHYHKTYGDGKGPEERGWIKPSQPTAANQQPNAGSPAVASTVYDEPEETMDDTETVVFPAFPVFPGALTDLSKALCPSLPLEAKIWAMVTYWGLMRSGLDTFGMEKYLQPRFYSMLIMRKWSGKTAVLNETRAIQERIEQLITVSMTANEHRACSQVNKLASVDTGQYLVAKFAELAEEKKKSKLICGDSGVKAMLDPDEAADFFEKGRTTSGRMSTLFTEMLKLYAGNRTGNGTKSGLQNGEAEEVDNAHFAVVCGTQVKKYPQLWIGTGSGNDGLRSRFTQIGSNAKKLPAFQEPSDEAAVHAAVSRIARLAQLPGQNIQLTDDGKAALTKWWDSVDDNKDSAARVLDIVKQLLIVLGVVNLPDDHQGTVAVVGKDLVDWATSFGDYLMGVRDRIDSDDSWSHVQAMENAIIDWYKNHASKKEPKSSNDCRRGIAPHVKPGGLGAFNQAWKNVLVAGVLKPRAQTQRAHLYSL